MFGRSLDAISDLDAISTRKPHVPASGPHVPASPHCIDIDVCTTGTYTETVGFEWDEASKAGINYRKHGVRMPEAIPAFDDPYAITITDDESDPKEQPFVSLGM